MPDEHSERGKKRRIGTDATTEGDARLERRERESSSPRQKRDEGDSERLQGGRAIKAELERRQREAEQDWKEAAPTAKRDFAREVGQVEHQDWQSEIRLIEARRGRVEGRDFGVEYVLQHPDGGSVRYDFVDFREHRIVDRKPQALEEPDAKVVREHERQRQRHIQAYEARFGYTPTYEYSPYPSTRDLFREPGALERESERLGDHLRDVGREVLPEKLDPHPGADSLTAYVDGSLDAESARHLRAHLVFCDECRELTSGLRSD